MIVVSDTTPLNYLLLIGQQELLPALFRSVYTVPAVMLELQHPRAPEIVRAWALKPPSWLRVQSPTRSIAAGLAGIGEAAAIALAQELRADVTLIDDARRGVSRNRRAWSFGERSQLLTLRGSSG